MVVSRVAQMVDQKAGLTVAKKLGGSVKGSFHVSGSLWLLAVLIAFALDPAQCADMKELTDMLVRFHVQ